MSTHASSSTPPNSLGIAIQQDAAILPARDRTTLTSATLPNKGDLRCVQIVTK